jgi:hypothetical protein
MGFVLFIVLDFCVVFSACFRPVCYVPSFASFSGLSILGLPLWYLQALLWLSLRFSLKFILTWKLRVRNDCDPYYTTIEIFSNFLIVNFPFIYSNLPAAVWWIVIIIYSISSTYHPKWAPVVHVIYSRLCSDLIGILKAGGGSQKLLHFFFFSICTTGQVRIITRNNQNPYVLLLKVNIYIYIYIYI